MNEMQELLESAVRACLRGGAEILSVYGTDDFQITHKDDQSPLTIADKRAHNVIVDELGSASTRLPVLSEEGEGIAYETRRAWTRFWLVDPLDGTKEFIKRNGEFTVNVALVEGHRPVLGVIYVPVDGELYFTSPEGGRLPKGAWVARVDPDVSLSEVFEKAEAMPRFGHDSHLKVIASRSHKNEATAAFISSLEQEHGDIVEVQTGSSRKLCFIADGRADIYPRFAPTMEWDTGAGDAIVFYAGGSLSHHDSDGPLQYNKENLLNPWFIARGTRMR